MSSEYDGAALTESHSNERAESVEIQLSPQIAEYLAKELAKAKAKAEEDAKELAKAKAKAEEAKAKAEEDAKELAKAKAEMATLKAMVEKLTTKENAMATTPEVRNNLPTQKKSAKEAQNSVTESTNNGNKPDVIFNQTETQLIAPIVIGGKMDSDTEASGSVVSGSLPYSTKRTGLLTGRSKF
jgi:membrane protein involved in colicin uptake